MTIIKYNGRHDIDVQFDDGTIYSHKTYSNFKKGIIKNVNNKCIYGHGFIGVGSYDSKNSKVVYRMWNHMLSRCYNSDDPFYISYHDCTVCEQWLCFQNFAEWYYNNYYVIENEKLELDKDIIDKNARIYSPETCCIVPKKINLLFIKQKSKRSIYPIGVSFHKASNKYISICSIDGTNKHLGLFLNPQDAFYKYKISKEAEIKRVAKIYKDKIPQYIYEALLKYEVDIDD